MKSQLVSDKTHYGFLKKTDFLNEEIVIITLPAKNSDDLCWREELLSAQLAIKSGKKLLWILDLGFDRQCCCLTDQTIFSGQVLALSAFSRLYAEFSESTQGAVLAESILFRKLDEKDEYEAIEHLDEPFKTHLSAMTLFADYLHRLASFLPEELRVMVFIDPDGNESEREILLSKERFRHIEVKKEEMEAVIGCVIPNDELCNEKIRKGLEGMLLHLREQGMSFRCIPEALLNEEWAGFETLVFLAPAITKTGTRMAQGFIASGGKVLYHG